jgi:hypothetical protein
MVGCMFDSRLLMSFLHISIADVYQIIHTLNNPMTVKVCFGVYISNCLIMLAFYHWLSSSNSQEYLLHSQGNMLVLRHNCYWRFLIYIRKMYFSYWKAAGVFVTMWSLNLDASISGEYQTLGEHSCRLSELLGARMKTLGAPQRRVE